MSEKFREMAQLSDECKAFAEELMKVKLPHTINLNLEGHQMLREQQNYKVPEMNEISLDTIKFSSSKAQNRKYYFK